MSAVGTCKLWTNNNIKSVYNLQVPTNHLQTSANFFYIIPKVMAYISQLLEKYCRTWGYSP